MAAASVNWMTRCLFRAVQNYRRAAVCASFTVHHRVAFKLQFYDNTNTFHHRTAISLRYMNSHDQEGGRSQSYHYAAKPVAISLSGILAWLGLEKEKEDPVVTIIKRGVLSIQKGDFKNAELIFHAALKLAQERVDPEAITYIYDCLANLAFQQGELPKAEELFKVVMQRMISAGMPKDDEAIVEMSLKLASIYSQQKDDFKAEEGFKFCIDTQRKRIDESNLFNKENLNDLDINTLVLWAMSLDWYAHHQMERGNLKASLENLQKALEVSQRVNGDSHPQTLVLINDIASVASMKKDYQMAIEYFQKAINLGISMGSPDLPVFYCNLGATLMHQGQLKEAHAACRKSLKLAKSAKNAEAMAEASSCLEELSKLKAASS